MAAQEYRILALYRFVPLIPSPNENADATAAHPERHPTLKALQTELYDALRPMEVRGTLLLAPEGINGTICYPYTSKDANASSDGSNGEISGDNDAVYQYLKSHPLFGGDNLRTRLSVWRDFYNEEDDVSAMANSDNNLDDEAVKKIQELKQPQQAFQRLKIKIKAEIVTMGLGRPLFQNGRAVNDTSTDTPADNTVSNGVQSTNRFEENQKCNPLLTKGQYLSPKAWDEAVRDPEVLVIDTRNTYEIDIGTFDGAIDPKTKHFAEFPEYLDKLAGEFDWSNYKNQSGGDAEDEATTNKQKPDSNAGEKKKPHLTHCNPIFFQRICPFIIWRVVSWLIWITSQKKRRPLLLIPTNRAVHQSRHFTENALYSTSVWQSLRV